jgi:hypothetical protein
MKLARPVHDRSGKTLTTRDEAKQYVIAKLQDRPNSSSWKHAAGLLLDDDATAEEVTTQLEYAMLLDGVLDTGGLPVSLRWPGIRNFRRWTFGRFVSATA